MKNLTALICLFARAYHSEKRASPVFCDHTAAKLLSPEEVDQIRRNMTAGIEFFCPGFSGSDEEKLDWIVHHQLAPSVVGRSAFCERTLKRAAARGCRQYLMFAAGYDTYACRNSVDALRVYELDLPEILEDKQLRLQRANLSPATVEYLPCDFADPDWSDTLTGSSYNPKALSFSSLLGICHYLSKEEFGRMLKDICRLISPGSELLFDYPTAETDVAAERTEQLAQAAGEQMKSKYTYAELEKMLESCGFLIYEHLNAQEMTAQYFSHNPDMTAPGGSAYVLAVKRR